MERETIWVYQKSYGALGSSLMNFRRSPCFWRRAIFGNLMMLTSLRYTPFNQHSNGKMDYFKMYFLNNLAVFNQASDIWELLNFAFLRLDRSSYTPTRQVGELVLPLKTSMEPEHFSQQETEKHRPKPPFFGGSKCWFGGYPPVNWHGNGKWTLWRCISLWKWGDFIAMLVYWRGIEFRFEQFFFHYFCGQVSRTCFFFADIPWNSWLRRSNTSHCWRWL